MTLEKIMKHHTEGGRMIRHFDGKKEYILSEEDMNYIQDVVKNCSIPDVVGQSEQLCDCDIPLIRTSHKGGEYCGLCQEDLD